METCDLLTCAQLISKERWHGQTNTHGSSQVHGKTYLNTGSIKGTARRLQTARIQSQYEDISETLTRSEEELYASCYCQDDQGPGLRELDFDRRLDSFISEVRRVGVTRKLLCEEYREQCAVQNGYSQFCERLSQAIGRRDLILNLQHTPSETMQVDVASKVMHWVDGSTGEVHKCPVLIAAMPHTQHRFAMALPSRNTTDFMHGLYEALRYFDGLPRVILSDNLKAFVTKADKCAPDFNALCVQLAIY